MFMGRNSKCSGWNWAYLQAQMVKNTPLIQETWVRALGLEDPPGEGNGNPLQYSGLENPMDRGAWRAAVHGATEDLGLIKQLSRSILTL